MPYDERLADRLRELVAGREGVTERRMFGGLGFMIGGNIACAAMSTGDLMIRLSKEESEVAVRQPGARPFEHGGRSMRGWVIVDPATVQEDADLARWVDAGANFAASLPPK
jgi:TfoX/Sxy family transcriptional regulator of competence genes